MAKLIASVIQKATAPAPNGDAVPCFSNLVEGIVAASVYEYLLGNHTVDLTVQVDRRERRFENFNRSSASCTVKVNGKPDPEKLRGHVRKKIQGDDSLSANEKAEAVDLVNQVNEGDIQRWINVLRIILQALPGQELGVVPHEVIKGAVMRNPRDLAWRAGSVIFQTARVIADVEKFEARDKSDCVQATPGMMALSKPRDEEAAAPAGPSLTSAFARR